MDPSGKMLFTCASCGYRARIPERYSGKEVHCPRCQVVQVAQPGAGGNISGQTLTFQNLKAAFVDEKSAMKSVEKPDDTVRFACSACNYSASLAMKHAGTTIRCPGCGASQMVPVKGDPAGSPANTSTFAKAPSSAAEDRILFTCGDCDYKARIPARYAGRSVLCPGCGKAVPASAGTAAAVANLVAAPASGNTAILTKVSTIAADGQPQTGAMTRVGMQFTCGNCGYQSRISPSCAGGVISCPSCRKEQKVDMGPGGTAASAALERKDGDDGIEPTITPARGNRIGSGPLPAMVVDEAEPEPLPPMPKPGSARMPTIADADADAGRTPSGRFPASVSPFTAELPPLPKVAPVAPVATPPKTDRRTAKTAPLPSVSATPARVAQVPVAKDAEEDEASLLAEARALAQKTPAPQPAATPAANQSPKTAVTARRTPIAAAAPAADAASAVAAAAANTRPSRALATALPAPRRRGMWAVSALLMMSVAACGVIQYQWQGTKHELATERGDHEKTRTQLAAEKAEHHKTATALSETQTTLATTTKQRDDEKSARAKVEDELAATKRDLGETKDALASAEKKIAAAEEQAKALQATIDEQGAARRKAESERDELETRWTEAKRRLGDLLGTDTPAKGAAPTSAATTPATTAAVPAVKRD